MLALVIEQKSGARTVELALPRTTIGWGPFNDVVFRDERVLRMHATVLRRPEGYFIEGRGTLLINGFERKTSEIAVGDELIIGQTTLRVVELPGLEDAEAALVQALQEGEDALRLVYADLLEDRGDVAFAKYVRAEVDFHRAPTTKAPLDALKPTVPPRCRALVARVPIELCDDRRCLRAWERLTLMADEPRTRVCEQCGLAVTFCDTAPQARRMMNEGPVAIDASADRREGDLLPLVLG